MKHKTNPKHNNEGDDIGGAPSGDSGPIGGGGAGTATKKAKVPPGGTPEDSGVEPKTASKLMVILECDESTAKVSQVLKMPASGKQKMLLGIKLGEDDKGGAPSPPSDPKGGGGESKLFVVLECDGEKAAVVQAFRLPVSQNQVVLIPDDGGDPPGGSPGGNVGPIGGKGGGK